MLEDAYVIIRIVLFSFSIVVGEGLYGLLCRLRGCCGGCGRIIVKFGWWIFGWGGRRVGGRFEGALRLGCWKIGGGSSFCFSLGGIFI